MSSIVDRNVVPNLNPYPHVPTAADDEPAEGVEPGQHSGGGWISGPSNPAPARAGAPSGCNPAILLMGIEAWLTEHGYRIDTAAHPNLGRAGLAADLLRSYGVRPQSAPLRQPVGHQPNG